jgi:hypothetical protein
MIYQAVAENMASEQSARMVSMKAASDNAKNVIGELQLDLQQNTSSSHYEGALRNCWWCGCGLSGQHLGIRKYLRN